MLTKSIIINSILNRFDLHLSRITEKKEIYEFWEMLRPSENGFELIRAGSEADGGYLVPNDLIGISKIISGGCDTDWSFEKFFLEKYQIESIIIDRIAKIPRDLSPRIEYIDAWLGEGNSTEFVSLVSILDKIAEAKENELLLKLDIEGAEFSELNRIAENDLKKFRILVIEFHGLDRIVNREFYSSVVSPVFRKIVKNFDLVHSHANNCCGAIKIHGLLIPRVMELTFHNRSRRLDPLKPRKIPHQLDAPNDPTKLDINWTARIV